MEHFRTKRALSWDENDGNPLKRLKQSSNRYNFGNLTHLGRKPYYERIPSGDGEGSDEEYSGRSQKVKRRYDELTSGEEQEYTRKRFKYSDYSSQASKPHNPTRQGNGLPIYENYQPEKNLYSSTGTKRKYEESADLNPMDVDIPAITTLNVLGWKETDSSELLLCEISRENMRAYALVPSVEVPSQVPRPTINALSQEYQRLKNENAKCSLLTIAPSARYGKCITPPEWSVIEDNAERMRRDMIENAVQDAVVQVEWPDGMQTWEEAHRLLYYARAFARLGKRNERDYRKIVGMEYLDSI